MRGERKNDHVWPLTLFFYSMPKNVDDGKMADTTFNICCERAWPSWRYLLHLLRKGRS